MTISPVESPFEFEELFFSRTDRRGIIESGNSVFQKVSKFQWNEILNAPHNIVRHPQTPRAVFHLLWEFLNAGQPIGAYVLNRAKDGSFYWVFAVANPVRNGFLSIRLKPSTPIFEIVKTKYSELVAHEVKNKLSPQDSQIILLQEITKLGFSNYRDFMVEALSGELEARSRKMRLPPQPVLAQMNSVLHTGLELQRKCDEISAAFKKGALVPLNLEIQAMKIGQEAASIAVVSSQYEKLAQEIHHETKKFLVAAQQVRIEVKNCQFDVCNSLLQSEILHSFKEENETSPVNKDFEMELLTELMEVGITTARISLKKVDLQFGAFKKIYEEMISLCSALEIIGITGKVEAAKIRQTTGELTNLLNELGNFKTFLKLTLKEIDELGNTLANQTLKMRDSI